MSYGLILGKVYRMTPNDLDMFKVKNTTMRATSTPPGPKFSSVSPYGEPFSKKLRFLNSPHRTMISASSILAELKKKLLVIWWTGTFSQNMALIRLTVCNKTGFYGFLLSGSLKVKSDSVIGLPIYAFLLMFNSKRGIN